MIASHPTSPADLNSLAQVDQRFNAILEPTIFKRDLKEQRAKGRRSARLQTNQRRSEWQKPKTRKSTRQKTKEPVYYGEDEEKDEEIRGGQNAKFSSSSGLLQHDREFHLKPYLWKVKGCDTAWFLSSAVLHRHERESHDMHKVEKPYLCPLEGCECSVPGHGFPRQWNLRDHMRRVHNDKVTLELPASPPPSKNSTSGPGRKRKKNDRQNKFSGQKSSTKSASDTVPSAGKAAGWNDRRKAIDGLAQENVPSGYPWTLPYIKTVQVYLPAMIKVSHKPIVSSKQDVM
ncbi:hypothetical protein B0H66DRAFT_605243 [Apodospora peruviana]|uniref:C2H2-type domain-containing protein n=1 Tax=Apodospora peruviana TaxID=516989 RepID=A0AAE0I1Q1_9PEZI|nr:hypothetical protein B0H66DRAFT_605243 [Apodospora peruviana]